MILSLKEVQFSYRKAEQLDIGVDDGKITKIGSCTTAEETIDYESIYFSRTY